MDPTARPVRLVVLDDRLARSRLTVFFRLLLALPHLLWLPAWGWIVFLTASVQWLVVTVAGRPSGALHGFHERFTRYTVHVGAYVSLAANPFPGFVGDRGYPVDLEVDPPGPQRRLGALVRLVLALPALALASLLAWIYFSVVAVTAFLIWFAALVTARAPRGLRDFNVYCLDYAAQTTSYLLFLSGRYPHSSPRVLLPAPDLPPHPLRLALDADELRRSRLLVFLRLPLLMPHLFWWELWALVVAVAAPVAWVTALVLGRLPRPFHRFFAAFTRYSLHVSAFLTLVGGLFPGFVGAAGSYPVDVEIDAPERQHRLSVLARGLLALPALLVVSVLAAPLYLIAFLAWWAALVTARMPPGFRDLGAVCLRYAAQVTAYLLLVTPRYPDASPAVEPRPEAGSGADGRRGPGLLVRSRLARPLPAQVEPAA